MRELATELILFLRFAFFTDKSYSVGLALSYNLSSFSILDFISLFSLSNNTKESNK